MKEEETPAEFVERLSKEYNEGMKRQKIALKLLLSFERFINITEHKSLPPNNINIEISSDLVGLFKDLTE